MTTGIVKLPQVLRRDLFSYFETRDMYACSRVSKIWKSIANDKFIELIKQMFHGRLPDTKNYMGFLHELELQQVQSNEELIRQIQAFLGKVQLGFNARFRCSFDRTSQLISIEIKGSEEIIPLSPIQLHSSYSTIYENSLTNYNYQEYCIAVNGIGDGSCKMQPPHDPKRISHFMFKLDSVFERTIVFRPKTNNCIQAVLRFPKISENSTFLERTIRYIIMRKCEQLSDQFANQESPLSNELTACALQIIYG